MSAKHSAIDFDEFCEQYERKMLRRFKKACKAGLPSPDDRLLLLGECIGRMAEPNSFSEGVRAALGHWSYQRKEATAIYKRTKGLNNPYSSGLRAGLAWVLGKDKRPVV